MRIIGYARVSSREQAENSHALHQQVARLEAAGASEVLRDVEQRRSDKRRNFKLLRELIRTHACDEVLVTRLDRLSGSLVTLREVVDEFIQSGVNLRALDDSIDLNTAAGRFQFNILGSLAEMEVDRLSERVLHGWSYLRKRKVAMNPPFGYIKVDDRHQLDHEPFLCLLINQRERSRAQVAREIVDAFFEKRTLRLALREINERYGIQTFAHNQGDRQLGGRVSQKLFRFSPAGLRNWLTNPLLCGHLAYLRRDKKRSETIYSHNSEQRLITDQEAQEITKILAFNSQKRGYGSTALRYPCSGLVFCGECRGAMYSTYGRKNYKHPERGYNYYFQCKNWRTRACLQKTTIRMEMVEEAVIDHLVRRAIAISEAASLPLEQDEPVALKELRSQLASLDKIPGHNSAIESAKQDLRNQIETFQYRIQQDAGFRRTDQELLLRVTPQRSFWRTLPDEKKQEYFRKLVDRVVVRNGQVELVNLKV